jgi:hypothetical protein
MVITAAVRGRTTSANKVQASQIFSQAHLRAYFMGIVKLAFATPAMTRIAIPLEVLLIIAFLPLSFSSSGVKPEVLVRQFEGRNLKGWNQTGARQIPGCDVSWQSISVDVTMLAK